MAEMAVFYLEGRNGLGTNRKRALSLMELAITIGKDIGTANTYVKALLEPLSSSGGSETGSMTRSRSFLPSAMESHPNHIPDDHSPTVESERHESIRRTLGVVDLSYIFSLNLHACT